jgi:hypothetical protein
MYLNIWFEMAKELDPGKSIFLPVSSKKEQTEIARLLRELKNEYIKVDPDQAMSLLIDSMFKDGKHFVFIKKIYATPLIGFLRDAEDGLSKDEIECNLGGLSDEEVEKYFSNLKNKT